MPGLDETGFTPLRLEEVRADLEARWRTAFEDNAQLDPESSDGQFIGIFSEMFAVVWEALESLYSAGSIDAATDAALDVLVALSGVERLEATATTVPVTLVGTPGTVLPVGRVIALDDTGQRFTLPAATIGGGGTVAVTATAEETGPIQALAGSAWDIETPVAGWTGVTQSVDAEVGRVRETNVQLRARWRGTMIAVGPAREAIRAALVRLTGVTEALVAVNTSSVTDADGRPPHSVEPIVRGGVDQEIVNTIWAAKSEGIRSYGTTVGVVTDSTGRVHEIGFSRPVEVPLYVVIDLEIESGFPADGEDQIIAAVLEFEQGLATGTTPIAGFKIAQKIETPGIVDLSVRVGRAANPLSDRAVMTARELAAFDSTRISFNYL